MITRNFQHFSYFLFERNLIESFINYQYILQI